MQSPVLENALDVLRQMPPGTALYAREHVDAGAWETAWLIREETARIARLGKQPDVELRTGVIEQNGILLIPVLLSIGPTSPEAVFETWINAYQARAKAASLEDLAIQPRIIVHLYGNGCRLERSLTVSNQLQVFARETLARLKVTEPWDMGEFDAARKRLYTSYLHVFDLWKALASV
jgi:hypothetical protein